MDGYDYIFIVKNEVTRQYCNGLEHLEFEILNDNNTKIYGHLKDKSEFYSVIRKIRDLGLEILLVQNLEYKECEIT